MAQCGRTAWREGHSRRGVLGLLGLGVAMPAMAPAAAWLQPSREHGWPGPHDAGHGPLLSFFADHPLIDRSGRLAPYAPPVAYRGGAGLARLEVAAQRRLVPYL